MQKVPSWTTRGPKVAATLAMMAVLAACENTGTSQNSDPTLPLTETNADTPQTQATFGERFGAFFKRKEQPEGTEAANTATSTELVERDVEAPDVFQVTESGLWDGRPSLGGVWVAHPDARDPERVIIRNNSNGRFVIGALFRREREIPGPRVQVSSDAADALGMLPGAPVEVNVTALRKETVTPAQPNEEPALEALTPEPVETASLDPIAGAAAAIDASAPAEATATSAPTNAPAPYTPPKPTVTSSLEKPFLQIGIFSIEANAKRTADMMRNAGMIPSIQAQSTNGKPFWRVLVGPAQTKSERTQLLKQVRDTGFTDAYAVTN